MDLKNIYNSEREVALYVKDLKTLHEISDYRSSRRYVPQETLQDFKILNGLIWFDTCGNTLIRVTKEGMYSLVRLPDETSICPVCKKGWNLHNLEDCVFNMDYINNEVTYYHKECKFINNLNQTQNQFLHIFNQIYPNQFSIKVIPNEYCQCSECSAWFIFSTPDGEIKIGWRKRVINIEWLSYSQFSEIFKDENVTKIFNEKCRNIHAWSEEKCIEYLQRAKNSICK